MQIRRCLDDTKKTVPSVVGNSAISPLSPLTTSTARGGDIVNIKRFGHISSNFDRQLIHQQEA